MYVNIAAPWSAFICGSQGSGKIHTLSVFLETALISASLAGKLTLPLSQPSSLLSRQSSLIFATSASSTDFLPLSGSRQFRLTLPGPRLKCRTRDPESDVRSVPPNHVSVHRRGVSFLSVRAFGHCPVRLRVSEWGERVGNDGRRGS